MFLKSLKIENKGKIIREIVFHNGINLIVDETSTDEKETSGNNVGKTTVLRLIDFCLGGNGKNIYSDSEFKKKTNTQIETFLKQNNITITLILKEDLKDFNSKEITIRRNFLARSEKIQEIDGKSYANDQFELELNKLIFNTDNDKPKFRQIIAKNIRDEKNRLTNTVKVLHSCTRAEEYETLYLFWLGIPLDRGARKQQLHLNKQIEKNFLERLKQDGSLSQIEQSLIIINRSIDDLIKKRDSFNINESYEIELTELNNIKYELNGNSIELGRLQLRKNLIFESKAELEKEFSNIRTVEIRKIYNEASALIPNLQKSFEETLRFHNQMVQQKMDYITQELPSLESAIEEIQRSISNLLSRERDLSKKLSKQIATDELQKVVLELNKAFEQKGKLEEQKRLWSDSQNKLTVIENELTEIDSRIYSYDGLIQERIEEFNKYFSQISSRLYGEAFVLSSDKGEKGYELNISALAGNLGTGKKKGQIAAFDIAYIQFADALGLKCLHFILHDQIENIHDNQIDSLLTEIISEVNCQYIIPVLRDKLPPTIDVKKYEVLSLSQDNKLFKV